MPLYDCEMKVMALQPPSPPFMDVDRECAGGFGVGQPNSRSEYGHNQYPYYSIQLAHVAGALVRDGYEVVFFDAQAEQCNQDSVVDKVLSEAPDIIVSVVNLPSLKADLDLLYEVRNALSGNVRIICIGSVCRVLFDEIIQHKGIDFVITGAPEVVIPIIIACREGKEHTVDGIVFKRENETIVTTGAKVPKNLDYLPRIPYHLLPMDRYEMALFGEQNKFATIVGSLGCPFDCGYYCPYPVGFGKHVRFRAVEEVVHEMSYLSKNYSVKDFVFRDQVFTLSKQRVFDICDRLIEHNLNINWVCETRFDFAKDELMLNRMKEAGCRRIHFGLETGDRALFENVAKPRAKFEDIEKVVNMLNRVGIDFHVHTIVGLPGETWDSVLNTATLLKALNIYSINPSIIVPYPGTVFYKEAKERGWISTYDWEMYTSRHAVVRTEQMSIDEIVKAHKYLMNVFSIKNHQSPIDRAVDKAKEMIKKLLIKARIGESRSI